MKKKLKIYGVLVLLVLAFSAYIVNKNHTTEAKPIESLNIEVKTFQSGEGWGYDVSIDGELYVHQPTIPAVPGNGGFETEDDARKTAELVVKKIRNNELPPRVSPSELKDLGILE